MGLPVPLVIILVAIIIYAGIREEKAKRDKFAGAYRMDGPPVLGNAGLATRKDLRKAGYLKERGVRLGFDPEGKSPLFYPHEGHILLTAAARTGKAFTVLVAAILTLKRRSSLIAFDPKGELAAVTGHARRKYGRVYVLNPFGILKGPMKGLRQVGINPMSVLDPKSPSFHAACDKLAAAFGVEDNRESHWLVSARIIISGALAALAKYGKPHERNLSTLRNVLTGANGHSFFEFCRECMKVDDLYIRQKLGRFAAVGAEDSKELQSVLSTADTITGPVGNEAVATSFMDNTFDFRMLKRQRGSTLYICLPLEMLDVADFYFRLIAALMLYSLLEEARERRGAPVLAIIDECAQIGYLKALEDAWGMAAGAANLQIFAVYQSVAQMMNQFQSSWQTIIQNCGVTIWFGARDQATREYVSHLAGVTEVVANSKSVIHDPRTMSEPHVTNSGSVTARPLFHPHEVGELGNDEMLMFCEGVRGAVLAKRKPYLSEFRGQYRNNPYFRRPGLLGKIFG